jgi:hypothetical protein
MHIFVDPDDGHVTGFIDWADLQAGDAVWDLAMSSCHFMSTSEGLLRSNPSGHLDLFPHMLAGYGPSLNMQDRIAALLPFYRAYRLTWAARMLMDLGLSPDRALENALLAVSSMNT